MHTLAHVQCLGVPQGHASESAIFRELVVAGGALLCIFGPILLKRHDRALCCLPLIKALQDGGDLSRFDQKLAD